MDEDLFLTAGLWCALMLVCYGIPLGAWYLVARYLYRNLKAELKDILRNP